MNKKFLAILKNILFFLAVFFIVQAIFTSFQKKEVIPAGDFSFTTTKTEYSRTKPVTLQIENNTGEAVTIPNECPGEPFDVYNYQNGEWKQVVSDPEINCEVTQPLTLENGAETTIIYDKWNHALFYDTGRFRIEFKTAEKTFTTNEFTVVEEGLFTKLWQGLFYRPIYNLLIFLAAVLPAHDLGLAIIILTLLARTILLIPSQKAMRSQRKMQDIQPRLEKIKEQYKGDQSRIASETMAAWKEAKVNPFGSCLPLLMQFPFLIAVFYVVQSGLNPDNTYLLYTTYAGFTIHDIQTGFFGIMNLIKPNVYVLPLIVGGLQFIQMKLTMARTNKNKGEKKAPNEMAMATNMMVYFLPVMIAVFTSQLPAGVGLYWGTSTLYGIVQQIFINREKPKKKDDEPTVRVISTNSNQ
ncbi:MAG: YidC/Oxa1 family membrane protein insertase [Candidatus Gracilibacteria bacterium]